MRMLAVDSCTVAKSALFIIQEHNPLHLLMKICIYRQSSANSKFKISNVNTNKLEENILHSSTKNHSETWLKKLKLVLRKAPAAFVCRRLTFWEHCVCECARLFMCV